MNQTGRRRDLRMFKKARRNEGAFDQFRLFDGREAQRMTA